MSDKVKTKIVKISENELVTMIEGLVQKGISEGKEKWLAEQATSSNQKLEETIEKLIDKKLAK